MAAPKPRSRDFGAALAGLVLGGSVMFLIMLTIVWLTNSHFEAGKADKKAHAENPPVTQVAAPGPIPSTTGTGTAAPVAPTPTSAAPPARR